MLDHFVLAGPDLAALVAGFTKATGIEPAPGGSHVGLGTANRLVGLGGGAYLELVGPDPEQPSPDRPRPFGIDELDAPRLVTFALRVTDLAAARTAGRAVGYDPGQPRAMSRRTPDGALLRWRLTPPSGGDLPFLIDWGSTPHPATRDQPEAPLVRAAHPDPSRIKAITDALGMPDPGFVAGPRIEIVVAGRSGPITLPLD